MSFFTVQKCADCGCDCYVVEDFEARPRGWVRPGPDFSIMNDDRVICAPCESGDDDNGPSDDELIHLFGSDNWKGK